MTALRPRRVTTLAAVTGLIASGVAALASAPAAQAATDPTPTCGPTTCSVTFAAVGSLQTFTVPALVTSVGVVARGGAGGTSTGTNVSGGGGGTVTGSLAVSAGTTLTVLAGDRGAGGATTTTYGGGGGVASPSRGGSGGGGSFVFTESGSLLVAAGGGGGAGYIRVGGSGSGHDAPGGDGINSVDSPSYHYTPTTGGTQSAGGRGGSTTIGSTPYGTGEDGSGPAANGSPGQGGRGGGGAPSVAVYQGGGGGGGYYGGGGGGYAQTGAGGSGFAAPQLDSVSSSSGTNAGAGSVTFTWSKAATTTTLTADPSSSVEDQDVTLTATVATDAGTPAGTVTFFNGGSTITGCGSVTVGQTGTASCTTSLAAGSRSLRARYSGDGVFAASDGSLTYAVASKPRISTTSLAGGTVDVAYSQQLTASGGTAPYTYALSGETTLPAGLSLSALGEISGTPTAAGTSAFTVKVSDSANPSRFTDKPLSITVGKADQTLTVTSNPPESGVVGGTHTLTVTGGRSSAPVSIAVSNGTTNSACSIGAPTTSVVDGAQIVSATVSYDKAGRCQLVATQAGDDDYTAATSADATIDVRAKQTTTTLALSAGTVVHGQPATATVTVTGGSAGTVHVAVDGTNVATKPLDGESASIEAALPDSALDVGTHEVTADFTPDDTDTYAASATTTASSLTVGPAQTTTKVTVSATTLVAAVTVNAPSTDVPTGTVVFSVADTVVGQAEIVDGVATLNHAAPTGKTVSAVYNGREDAAGKVEISSSSASTAVKIPTITAHLTSGKSVSEAGWYSRPVVVQFRCRAGSAAIKSCPWLVTVNRDGVTTVSRTIEAADGGVATVSTTVKLDRTRPTVSLAGVTHGRTYTGPLPEVRCVADDNVSGVSSCRIASRTKGSKVTFTATAIDRAGNVSRTSATVRHVPA